MKNREIKFRRSHFKNGKFLKFSYWGFIDGVFVSPTTISGCTNGPDEQYSDLKDRNGVDIYEGDILADELSRDQLLFNVVFSDGRFKGNTMPGNHTNGYLDAYSFSRYYVIGNIHETEFKTETA
jgi:hypothetical protein